MSTINLKNITHSIDMKNIFFSLEQSSKDIFTSDHYSKGIFIYRYFSEFLVDINTEIDSNDFVLWDIVINKLIEHNKLLYERYVYLNNFSNFDFAIRVQQSSINNLKIIYAQSRSYLRAKKIESLERISEKFLEIYQQQKRALPIILDELINYKLSERGSNCD